MPLYEYECDACGHRFEVIQKYSDAPISVCPKCGGHVQKLLSSPAIQFKGSGFYITDYGRSGKSDGEGSSSSKRESSGEKADKAGAAAESKGESKGETKDAGKSESKSDAKTESKIETKPASKPSASKATSD